MTKTVELRRITEDNFIDAFNLKLASGQESFVSHPIRSLAQAYVYRDQCQPLGIYAEDKMIGYVMVIYDYDIPEYDIWHMMIDESMQGRGCGGAALDRVIDYLRTKPFGDSDRVALTCKWKPIRIIRKGWKLRRKATLKPTGMKTDRLRMNSMRNTGPGSWFCRNPSVRIWEWMPAADCTMNIIGCI